MTVHIQRKRMWVYLCKCLIISLWKKYRDTCKCCWLLRSMTLTFVMISYGKSRPSRWPATYVFQLKMHWDYVQSCHVSASCLYYARQNFLLCSVWLKMRINFTVRHVTHWPPCKRHPEEKATKKFFREYFFFFCKLRRRYRTLTHAVKTKLLHLGNNR